MDDVDAALEGLSEKELAEINEYVDPEVSAVTSLYF